MTETFQEADNLELLKVTPAMYLGSCRYKLPNPEDDPAVYETIFRFFEKMEITAFFYIGGNDSMDTVDKLSAYARSRTPWMTPARLALMAAVGPPD